MILLTKWEKSLLNSTGRTSEVHEFTSLVNMLYLKSQLFNSNSKRQNSTTTQIVSEDGRQKGGDILETETAR